MFQNFWLQSANQNAAEDLKLVNDQEDKCEVEDRHEPSSMRNLLVQIDQKVSFWQNPGKETSYGELYSGSRGQLGRYEPLELSPMERTKSRIIWTIKTPIPALVIITDLILVTFLTETLSARRSSRTTRLGRRITTRRRSPWPPWTWPPTRCADRTSPTGPPHRMWCQVRDPLVTSSNTGGIKLTILRMVWESSPRTNITRFTLPSQDMPDNFFNLLAKNALSNLENLRNLNAKAWI